MDKIGWNGPTDKEVGELNRLADEAKKALEVVKFHEGKTVEGWLSYGAALNKGRKFFPRGDNTRFSEWLSKSQLAICSADERAAAMWAAENEDELYRIFKEYPKTRTVRGAHQKFKDEQVSYVEDVIEKEFEWGFDEDGEDILKDDVKSETQEKEQPKETISSAQEFNEHLERLTDNLTKKDVRSPTGIMLSISLTMESWQMTKKVYGLSDDDLPTQMLNSVRESKRPEDHCKNILSVLDLLLKIESDLHSIQKGT